MIYIQKKYEPAQLNKFKIEHGKTAKYDDFCELNTKNIPTNRYKGGFDALRQFLVEEQKFICCYCQQRIGAENTTTGHWSFQDATTGIGKMKTEHFQPQKKFPQLQLTYKNLLASCKGNSNKKGITKHCDTSKGDSLLKQIQNPAKDKRKFFKPLITYRVRKNSKEVIAVPIIYKASLQKEINKVLNLNEQGLKSKRFAAWNAVWKQLFGVNGNAKPSIHKIKMLLELYNPNSNQKVLKPFCGFIHQWIKQRFKNELIN